MLLSQTGEYALRAMAWLASERPEAPAAFADPFGRWLGRLWTDGAEATLRAYVGDEVGC